MNTKYVLFFFVCNLFLRGAIAQNHELDSLKCDSRTTREDTNKVKLLNNLSWKLRNVGQYDSCLAYSKKAEVLAKKLKYKKGEGKALTITGILLMDKGQYALSDSFYRASLKVREQINDKKGIAACYNNMGNLFEARGNLPKALQMQLMGLKIREEINDKQDMAASYNNIGNIYNGMKNPEAALKNFFTSLKIKEEIGDRLGMAMSYGNIGLIQEARLQHEEALKNYNFSLKIEKETGYKMGMGDCYSNIGEVYHRKGMQQSNEAIREKCLNEARANYLLSLKIREEIEDKQGMATSFSNLGSIYYCLKQFKQAETYSLKGQLLAKELNDLDLLKDIYKNLSDIFTAMGKHKEALQYYKYGIAARDSLNNEENTKKITRTEMNYEFDKKEAATQLDQEKKEAVAAAESKKQRIVLILVSWVLILVFIFAIFAYRSFLQKQKANEAITKQKEIIEEKQKEILDSIYYARRIQDSLLTSPRYINKNLNRLLKNV